jgi:hypothetical protein
MSLIYTIAFTYFLRFDEVLHIKVQHIQVHNPTTKKVELILDFWKTHQTGGKILKY